jgi:hypothetical protein
MRHRGNFHETVKVRQSLLVGLNRGRNMSRLIVSETEEQVQLRWLGLHVAFAKDAGLPRAWREVVATPSSEMAIYDWLAAFGHLDKPGDPLPGGKLREIADGAREPLVA